MLNTVSSNWRPAASTAFRASGTTVLDPGFLAVYEEGKDTKTSEDEDEGRRCPPMKLGQNIPLTSIHTDQHFTEPPPRFSEACLVKALEEYGIGRPSTYASIIQVLLSRDYVLLDNKRFQPSDVGRVVANFLTSHFTRYVDYDFTAKLEDELDAVSPRRGRLDPAARAFLEAVQGDRRRQERDRSIRTKRPARACSATIRPPASRSTRDWAATGRSRRSAPPRTRRSRSSLRCVPARACTRSRWRRR